jgi:uncharacterized protein (TIGR00369 family)
MKRWGKTLTDQVTKETFEQYAGVDPAAAGQQLNEKVGMKLLEVTAERVVGTIPVEGNLQPYGLLHGGANAVLAEALGSVVAALNAGADRAAMGLELSCTHHRAVRSGLVTGVATPVHVGRGTITTEIVITDDQGRRTCTARLTCVVRDKPPGA